MGLFCEFSYLLRLSKYHSSCRTGALFWTSCASRALQSYDLYGIDLGEPSIWVSCCLFAGRWVQATDHPIFATVLDAVSVCVEAEHLLKVPALSWWDAKVIQFGVDYDYVNVRKSTQKP